MASSRLLCRFSFRLKPFASNSTKQSLASELSSPSLPSRSNSTLNSRISRLAVQLSSIESMMPLHSAVASARLISSLSIDSQTWSLVPQGISMPL